MKIREKILYIFFAICLLFSVLLCCLGFIIIVKFKSLKKENLELKLDNDISHLKIIELEDKLKNQKVFSDSLSKDNFKAFIKTLHIRFPDVVLAQSEIEANMNLNSKLAKSNNNFFGMRKPNSRPTTASGEKNGYAYYDSWQLCVIDYALYQASCLKTIDNGKLRYKTKKEYINHLGKSYAEDSTYKSKIKNKLK